MFYKLLDDFGSNNTINDKIFRNIQKIEVTPNT